MPEQILTRIRAFLVEHNLSHSGVLLIVAVSGGPDSLCLLHALYRLREAGGPQLHVAHLDHSFRGAESAAEAVFVAETAAAWAIPATVTRRDVPTLARSLGQGAQAAARVARYAFLAEVAEAQQAAAVVVAHQADDQAETVLFHLLRGAGLPGLRGMRAVVPSGEWQEAGGRRQEAGGRRQEAGGRRQEAGGRRQEAGGRGGVGATVVDDDAGGDRGVLCGTWA
jgi:tRNA(Ile)-lysidine synthase